MLVRHVERSRDISIQAPTFCEAHEQSSLLLLNALVLFYSMFLVPRFRDPSTSVGMTFCWFEDAYKDEILTTPLRFAQDDIGLSFRARSRNLFLVCNMDEILTTPLRSAQDDTFMRSLRLHFVPLRMTL